jgi:Pyruvate/2-oxoacid:ferredoxin oxidoreductase gamma subunit
MRLVLKGSAGQGIQLMSYVLANILKDKGFNVSMMGEYSPLIRTGDSMARLVFSKEEIENPLFDEAEMEYDLMADEYKGIKVLNMYLIGAILKKLDLGLDGDVMNYLPARFVEENLRAMREGYGK